MQVYNAIMSRRTIRRFTQKEVPHDLLVRLVDCARMAAYGANLQPLKFALIETKALCDAVFPHTKWAGYLEDKGPKDGEQPTAYLAILGDNDIKQSFETEAGAAGMTVLLAAEEMGLGACWLGAIDKQKLPEILKLPEHLSLLYLIALGYPAENSRPVLMKENDVKYFYTEDGMLNVPKRSLEEVLIKIDD